MLDDAEVVEADPMLLVLGAALGTQITDALIDTGATMLSLPKGQIEQLGLKRHRTRTARTPAGVQAFGVYEAVRLTVQDRDCVVEVCEISDDCPPLIGRIPLEALDFVVDPVGQRLIGNPDHGGQQMIDLLYRSSSRSDGRW